MISRVGQRRPLEVRALTARAQPATAQPAPAKPVPAEVMLRIVRAEDERPGAQVQPDVAAPGTLALPLPALPARIRGGAWPQGISRSRFGLRAAESGAGGFGIFGGSY